MRVRLLIATLCVCCLVLAVCADAAPRKKSKSITWQAFSGAVFDRAKAENKKIVLNIKSKLCAACSQMDQSIFNSPKVIDLINLSYLAVSVDSAERPDLANRYLTLDLPVNVVLSADATELGHRSGILVEEEFVAWLQKFVTNPAPEAAPESQDLVYAESPELDQQQKNLLSEKHYESADLVLGGLKASKKYLDPDALEWSLSLANQGVDRDAEMYKRTLRYNLRLIDPVWGGIFDYSNNSDWDHPEYSKSTYRQAIGIEIYGRAYAMTQDVAYLKAAMEIYRYSKDFLTAPDGSYYAGQSAEIKPGQSYLGYFSLGDFERRKLGVPAVDQAMYPRNSGKMIRALAVLYEASGNEAILNDAVGAAQAIVSKQAWPGSAAYLDDALSMAAAYLSLYQATGTRYWLTQSDQLAQFISNNFIIEGKPGLITAIEKAGDLFPPIALVEENIRAARFYNLLFRYTGNQRFKIAAESSIKFLVTPQIAASSHTGSGILMAEAELSSEPLHLTVVGPKADVQAIKLFRECSRYFSIYKRLDWWDKAEGPLPNPDVEYPELDRSAAFVCTQKKCSLPIYESEKLANLIDKITAHE